MAPGGREHGAGLHDLLGVDLVAADGLGDVILPHDDRAVWARGGDRGRDRDTRLVAATIVNLEIKIRTAVVGPDVLDVNVVRAIGPTIFPSHVDARLPSEATTGNSCFALVQLQTRFSAGSGPGHPLGAIPMPLTLSTKMFPEVPPAQTRYAPPAPSDVALGTRLGP